MLEKWQAVLAMNDRYFHSAFIYASLQVLTCHFLLFYAIFALKFLPILAKDLKICLNSNILRKRNPLFKGFSVTVVQK